MLKVMAAREPARHALYSQLENVLGAEHAATLMTYLPGERSDEVSTKGDISRLEEKFDARFRAPEDRFDRFEERMEERMDRMEERMDRMQRFYVGTTVGSMTALTASFSLVVAFLG